MGRRLTRASHFTVLVLISTLILSFIYVPIAVSHNSAEIMSKLKDLREDVSQLLPDEAFENVHSARGQRKALINKVTATIHQIEAGAYEGAINKLQNDLKNTIMTWVTDDYAVGLIEKIDKIISLIKGEVPPPPEDETPPSISSVLGVPEVANYDEDVTIIAQVDDEESGVDFVLLCYFTNTVGWINVTMNLQDDLYVAQIPAQPYDTHVSYKVYAYDKADNSAVSDTYAYAVIDSYAPAISWVERSPISPNYNDTVSVTASVSEPEEASGVQLVILSYLNGVAWKNVTMTLEEETVYERSIPEFSYGTTVEYMVYASDKAENWAVSSIYSYIVGDEYPPIVRIDKPVQGSYVKGVVEVVVFVYDDNFEKAELSINGTIVESWASTGEHTYNWDTTTYIDGVYKLDLTARDKAGNIAEEAMTLTVDQTLPSAIIDTPEEGSYVKGLIIISVTGSDNNFEKLQLCINTTQVLTLNATGTYTYAWNTSNIRDGVYIITLEVYDKANNTATAKSEVFVDNTFPTVEIKQPQNDAYVKGTFNVLVYGNDTNFLQMSLYIGENPVETWIAGGEQTYIWDTSLLSDGSYTMKLIVSDIAGNFAEKQLALNVDNTPPTARINAPDENAFLQGLVIINVTGEDANLEKMQLYIGMIDVLTLEASGTYAYVWNTSIYIDDTYAIRLEVHDKAHNTFVVDIAATVDNTLPDAEIRQPSEESHLRGTILCVIYGNDTNFDKMVVYIGEELPKTWTESGEYIELWNTLKKPDGVYEIKLSVSDKASNQVEKIVTVTVDNTLPTAVIHAPIEGSFLRGAVLINVTGHDVNFKEMELRIDDVQVKTWMEAGSQIYSWNTQAYSDGIRQITLFVYDKAENSKQISTTIFLDNAAPAIESPTWTPVDPSVDTQVNVTVKVNDSQPSSGIQNVTLWYRNTTMNDWQSIRMSLNITSGNWTAAIPAQSVETTIRFYVEVFDNADNKAVSDKIHEYRVVAPSGIPLAWIVVIIFLILAATVAAIYFWRKRRREKQGVSSSRVKDYKLTVLLCF